MSGICGWVGRADRSVLDAMLAAIEYRGNSVDTFHSQDAALGYRWWSNRPGKSQGVHHSGTDWAVAAGALAPSVESPAAELAGRMRASRFDDLDGAYAGAWWDAATGRLSLIRDPFGIRSLYYVTHAGVFYFASELKQLLAIPGLPIELDHSAVHKYLTFSFVPGEDVPIAGIKRLLPRRVGVFAKGKFEITRYFQLHEEIDPTLEDPEKAAPALRKICRTAVEKRLTGEDQVGLYLSGGLDSAAIAFWLKRCGKTPRLLSLDFGEKGVERDEAALIARHLELPIEFVPAGGEEIGDLLADIVWKLDLPFGDAVTGPHYLLGRAASRAGITVAFNGEGGDQFFGGWQNKPMLSAAVYGEADESPEEQYLRSYHRFYGLENDLYSPDFSGKIGPAGQRRALLEPYLSGDQAATFLNRLRLADIGLKGSQNILPRAERMANAWAVDIRSPLFDRELAQFSFRLPPQMKLRGACEKYILKVALQKFLPREIVWRRKYGMSVPITDWVLGPLAKQMKELLNGEAVVSRGLFRPDYVAKLLRGENDANEVRRRRLGERVFALAMLEAWIRIFIDGRGQRPGGRRPK
jgi:asparagine synthase (glutamine-hydrolysing)